MYSNSTNQLSCVGVCLCGSQPRHHRRRQAKRAGGGSAGPPPPCLSAQHATAKTGKPQPLRPLTHSLIHSLILPSVEPNQGPKTVTCGPDMRPDNAAATPLAMVAAAAVVVISAPIGARAWGVAPKP
ncbi:hypothetical protein PLESTB_000570200 [Pleodorina starrii]|uniref:Uncharacterized protein n=1 Tax=Pleodorina starrii TaxID=330485 RepID=A0A9W6BGW2_9CHLO|nr:hypothetical protein PLESTM_000314500 [Pleodorina starrii]GLC51986.1 hypothetical protein PLESTB_000570200 [Pleodorina starrii]